MTQKLIPVVVAAALVLSALQASAAQPAFRPIQYDRTEGNWFYRVLARGESPPGGGFETIIFAGRPPCA